jgi:probable rRNA maturation factor
VDPDSKRLHVSVSDGRGRRVRDGGLARWLAAVAPAHARGEVGVALATDAHVRKLNRQYRRRDAATDVLSFPASPGPPPPRVEGSGGELGDIIIATGVARRQARAAGHTYHAELRVLALHGLLHLLGYDHSDEHDSGRMGRVESRLRRKGGLDEGLIERAAAPAARARK